MEPDPNCHTFGIKGIAKPKNFRKAVSKAMTGVQKTKEHKTNISKALKGQPKTEEHRKKISEARKKFWSNKHLQKEQTIYNNGE